MTTAGATGGLGLLFLIILCFVPGASPALYIIAGGLFVVGLHHSMRELRDQHDSADHE